MNYINNINEDIFNGIYYNRLGLEFKVIDFDCIRNKNSYYIIEFKNTGYRCSINRNQIKTGNVKDQLYPSVANVGYRGITNVSIYSREYSIWSNMINRCYNPNSTEYCRYGAKGIYVCDRWHSFQYFCEDLPFIDGYDYELFHNGLIYLDKDYKQQNSIYKYYSLETCTFLSASDNTSLACLIPIVGINMITSETIYANSITEMKQNLNISGSQISNNINGLQNSCHGYKFLKVPIIFNLK